MCRICFPFSLILDLHQSPLHPFVSQIHFEIQQVRIYFTAQARGVPSSFLDFSLVMVDNAQYDIGIIYSVNRFILSITWANASAEVNSRTGDSNAHPGCLQKYAYLILSKLTNTEVIQRMDPTFKSVAVTHSLRPALRIIIVMTVLPCAPPPTVKQLGLRIGSWPGRKIVWKLRIFKVPYEDCYRI